MKCNLKKLGAFMLAVILLVCMVGCGKNATDVDEQGRTIVKIGGYPEEGNEFRPAFDERIAEFEKNNPDVKVDPIKWNFNLSTFYTQAYGGQLPHLISTNFTEVVPSARAGVVADISDVLKKHGYEGMFNEQIIDALKYDDGIYSFPNSAYLLGIIYNTELFEKAGLMKADGTPIIPKTWDELVEFGVKIKEKTGKPAIVFPTTNNAGGWIFTPIAWSYGVQFVKENEDGTYSAVFDSPEAVAALQFMKDLKWKYGIVQEDTLVDNQRKKELFATGGAAMIIDNGGSATQFSAYDMDNNKVGAMGLPAGPKKHVTLMGGNAYMMSADASKKQQDGIMRWIKAEKFYELTDEVKKNIVSELEVMAKNNQLIGVKTLTVWSQDAEYTKYYNEMVDKYANININHVKPFNDFVADCPAEIRPEERICAQELYSILDGCLQEVWSSKDADVAAIIKKANNDFQRDYLDNY